MHDARLVDRVHALQKLQLQMILKNYQTSFDAQSFDIHKKSEWTLRALWIVSTPCSEFQTSLLTAAAGGGNTLQLPDSGSS